MIQAIKAFRKDKDGYPRYLFHGNKGSLAVPFDRWVRADEKMVSDGSGKTTYKSGFHGFVSIDAIIDWKKTLKYDDKILCPVSFRSVRKKAHSKHKGGVVLARYMYLSKNDWVATVGLTDTVDML